MAYRDEATDLYYERNFSTSVLKKGYKLMHERQLAQSIQKHIDRYTEDVEMCRTVLHESREKGNVDRAAKYEKYLFGYQKAIEALVALSEEVLSPEVRMDEISWQR